MIFLIMGGSHTGKTLLAQKMLETYQYPYISIDHLKMGLIRSGHTTLTVLDDEQLTNYLWPIVCEIIKTAIENKQNLIVEGCYIKATYKNDFSLKYLPFIRCICLIFDENYIQNNYESIMHYGSVIEQRFMDDYKIEDMVADNKVLLEACKKHHCAYILIEKEYNIAWDPDIILTSERLILRRLKREDFQPLCKILQDAEVMYAYEHSFSDQEVQEWLDRQLNRYDKDGFGLWAVILKSTNEMIGQCGLTMQECNQEKVVEIGYLFQKAFWHKGYATEAAKACKKYAFEQLKVDEVFSIIRDNNTASQNVALRNEMTVKSKYTKFYYGVEMPHLIYSIRKEVAKEI